MNVLKLTNKNKRKYKVMSVLSNDKIIIQSFINFILINIIISNKILKICA